MGLTGRGRRTHGLGHTMTRGFPSKDKTRPIRLDYSATAQVWSVPWKPRPETPTAAYHQSRSPLLLHWRCCVAISAFLLHFLTLVSNLKTISEFIRLGCKVQVPQKPYGTTTYGTLPPCHSTIRISASNHIIWYQFWYKSFPPDNVETNDSTMLGCGPSTACYCVEEQIWEHLIRRTTFRHLCWTISKITSWNLATR